MEIELLGSVTLRQAGRGHGVASRKVRTVLALLALSPGVPLSLDTLADELWADKPVSNVRNALQANIARLRKLVFNVTGEREVVRTVSSGYLMTVPAEAVDAHRFSALAQRGATLLGQDPRGAITAFEQALRLWRGPALLDVADCTRCRMAAGQLNEHRLTVQEDLISARLQVGEHHGLSHDLKQLVAENPARERLSEYLMISLYRDGRQGEAVSVFHSTRKWLSAELGLEPGPGLRRLYQSILMQDQVLD
ncbi:AfsR/SARP family transcriptional regulator [Amycolatopsis rubida]|uniref:AfsR/SARP family transcriptional regulator n=1 Tax=Amycolatopsis rubida TaxID=112413 RepID=A0A1I5NEI3_9PSEU|nr:MULTISPECIES: AfsR/SARP family transcriptional regulator [Amycolatopsis]MYW92886.1 SARP family transcriptional regulator [Amycolatopsis rubida]NEC57873.1 AfsR/SARP family transcriptional regulator [Amycolatopsis rubida]OAP21607.1 Transcriptional regulatory protein MoaR1 [Amycolatopsis sp. M39]SFP20193.1 DNA-binding transcriptional activator of the SARP family [Amycolatopsis rubida]